jgi:signal transduction histidine kinase
MAAFAPLAKSRRVSVAVSAEPGLMAPLSRDAFRVALQNLLDNAVKYGPAGQTVRVGVALDGDTIVVSVDDQGGGVPAAERTAMWEPFRRGSDDAARTVGGSGIGLSIVRDVMNQHGGRAYITDAPGGGARFVLCLPGGARRRTEQTGREHPVRPAVSTLH